MSLQIEPIGEVVEGRSEVADDYWGGVESVIELAEGTPPDAVQGLEEFSHLVVVWHFHQAAPSDVEYHARSPRGDSAVADHRHVRAPQSPAAQPARPVVPASAVGGWSAAAGRPTSTRWSARRSTTCRRSSRRWRRAAPSGSRCGRGRCSGITGPRSSPRHRARIRSTFGQARRLPTRWPSARIVWRVQEQGSSRSCRPSAITVVDLGLADPLPHHGLGQVEVLADLPTIRSPRRHASTISALNSGVNEQHGHTLFFAMLSMMDILPAPNPRSWMSVKAYQAHPQWTSMAIVAKSSP